MSREQRSYLITTDDAVRHGFTRATLHHWSSRGIVTRYGRPRSALWDYRELLAARDAPHGQKKEAVKKARHAA